MENKIIVFTLVVDNAGNVLNVTNVKPEEFAVLYRALRAVENRIFEDITAQSAGVSNAAEVPNATDSM